TSRSPAWARCRSKTPGLSSKKPTAGGGPRGARLPRYTAGRQRGGGSSSPRVDLEHEESCMRGLAWLTSLVVAVLAFAVGEAHAQGAIKIGMIAPLSGPFAQIGKDMVTGTELYLDEIGRQAAGRKIELLVEDDEGNPSVGVTKVRKLVEGDRVHVVTGGLLAWTGYAIQPYVDAQKIPTTYPVMAGDDMTQRKPAKWVVRTGFSSSQSHHPFGEWAATQLKYKRVAAVAADYAFGWESLGGFQKTFEDAGGQIVPHPSLPPAP